MPFSVKNLLDCANIDVVASLSENLAYANFFAKSTGNSNVPCIPGENSEVYFMLAAVSLKSVAIMGNYLINKGELAVPGGARASAITAGARYLLEQSHSSGKLCLHGQFWLSNSFLLLAADTLEKVFQDVRGFWPNRKDFDMWKMMGEDLFKLVVAGMGMYGSAKGLGGYTEDKVDSSLCAITAAFFLANSIWILSKSAYYSFKNKDGYMHRLFKSCCFKGTIELGLDSKFAEREKLLHPGECSDKYSLNSV